MILSWEIFLFVILVVYLLLGVRIIYEYERAIVFTLGRYSYVLKPGFKMLLPGIQTASKIDTRVRTLDVPKQDCITKDNVSVNVDAVCYYFVSDVKKAILNVENYFYAILQLSQTTLRDVVGEVVLDALLANREDISGRIQTIIDKATDDWGIKVQRVELKHVELPQDMQRIMAREAEAERERRGVIIKSKGEVEAAQNIAQAAQIMLDTPGALQIRTLQTINDIAPEPSQKIIFFPTDFVNTITGKSQSDSNSSAIVEKLTDLLKDK